MYRSVFNNHGYTEGTREAPWHLTPSRTTECGDLPSMTDTETRTRAYGMGSAKINAIANFKKTNNKNAEVCFLRVVYHIPRTHAKQTRAAGWSPVIWRAGPLPSPPPHPHPLTQRRGVWGVRWEEKEIVRLSVAPWQSQGPRSATSRPFPEG